MTHRAIVMGLNDNFRCGACAYSSKSQILLTFVTSFVREICAFVMAYNSTFFRILCIRINIQDNDWDILLLVCILTLQRMRNTRCHVELEDICHTHTSWLHTLCMPSKDYNDILFSAFKSYLYDNKYEAWSMYINMCCMKWRISQMINNITGVLF